MRPSLKRHVLVLLREELGLNQKDFADYVGCSESTLQAVERGPSRLKLSETLAEKIFSATGVCPEWLVANDFSQPMIEGISKKPYNKAIFEAIQARKHLPSTIDTYYYRMALHCRLAEFSSVLAAAQNVSAEAAMVVMYRLEQLSKTLAAEFGENDLFKQGQGPNRALKALGKIVEPWATLTLKPVKVTREQMDAHAAKYGPLTALVRDKGGKITGTVPLPTLVKKPATKTS